MISFVSLKMKFNRFNFKLIYYFKNKIVEKSNTDTDAKYDH